MKKIKYVIYFFILIIVILGIWVLRDIRHNKQNLIYDSKPASGFEPNVNAVLWDLENGKEPDYQDLYDTCDYIDSRYDKSDFALSVLVRIMYNYRDELPEDVIKRVETTFLNFKYWMDQPGEDSMCYWSENHQILFASSEYLIGQMYSDHIFANDNLDGKQHMDMAEDRINIWLEQRWLYGFSEWYSNNYYKEDLLALSQIIEFSEEDLMVTRAKIITDLLLYDVATQSFKGTFVSTSGRMYEANKKSGNGNRLNRIEEELWGFDLDAIDKEGGLDLSFLYIDGYQVPQVLTEIAHDTSPVIIKASNGLNTSELLEEDLIGQKDNQIMMQWGMEAFTNPEVINNSLEYIDNNRMFSNEFLSDFSLMNIELVKNSFVLPFISDNLNLKTNGVALQRANTYTYKTNEYMLATAQNYHPGTFGDQQHIWSAVLSNEVSVFTIHPAEESNAESSGTPNYWVGSGRLPHSVQFENINMTMYVLPNKKGLLEETLLYFTHAYVPKELMDQVIIDENYMFGKIDGVYIAMIGKENLNYATNSNDDLLQDGQTTYWITELSSIEVETFEEFMERIYCNEIYYDEEENQLIYYSNENKLELVYQNDFFVNSEVVVTDYLRHDSPYAKTEFKEKVMNFSCNGSALFLDYYNGIREIYDE